MRERFELSGSSLKIIAMVTMLIDHIAAVLLVKWLITQGVLELMDYNGGRAMMLFSTDHAEVVSLYQWMRNIGRIAFPIYCFMLVEGFVRTRNVYKYWGRLLVTAIASEIPFDLAFAGTAVYWGYQNVMFTLILGLTAMMISSYAEEKTDKQYVKWLAMILAWTGAALAAEFILADYGAKGILCIGVLYLFRYIRTNQLIAGAVAFCWELPAPAAFLILALYKGKKGASRKKFFYAFYPVHLMILYLISVLLGMCSVAVI